MTRESTGGSSPPPFLPSPGSSPSPASASGQPPGAPRPYAERRFTTPRRVRHGLKLRSKLPFAPKTPLGQRWMRLIESAIASSKINDGAEYARTGQTVTLLIGEDHPGVISAQVQGTAARAYNTRIQLHSLDAEQWDRVVQAMSHEAVYVAKLLANDLPPAIDEVFRSAGVELLPASLDAGRFQCDCQDGEPCKHAAAISMLVAEHFDREPLSIFSLLGLPVEKLLDRIRQARAVHDHAQTQESNSGPSAGGGSADIAGGQANSATSKGNGANGAERRSAGPTSDPMIPESQVEPLPLEQCLDDFWRAGPRLAELESRPPRQHIPHALLRRLGPSPLNGKFPLVGLLASIYDSTAAAARALQQKSIEADAEPSAGASIDDQQPYNDPDE